MNDAKFRACEVVEFPIEHKDRYKGTHSVHRFKRGLGPCGKVVTYLGVCLNDSELIINQVTEDYEEKLFCYPRDILAGRIVVTVKAAPAIVEAPAPVRVKPTDEYTGHGANTGGLQQHSVGDLYPYIIQYRPLTQQYEVLHGPDGKTLGRYATYDSAADATKARLKSFLKREDL